MQAGWISMGVGSVLPIPRVMPGYRLLSRRGRGGFAEVWEAEAPGGFRVALKLVRPTPRARDRELRAIEIIRTIRHPNLLALFGAWLVEDLLVVGMELADRSLWDRFLQARTQGLAGIPRRELLGYLEGAAAGIDYLNGGRHAIDGHPAVGIQHRDLKPENILLFDGTAKVADFGMVRLMEGSLASHTGTWTLPYAAPEFFRKQTARQSDQYALAVTYCQLRGGRLPFRGGAAEIMAGHMFAAPDLGALPEPERPIVARALSKWPDDRWQDCRTLIAALRSLDGAAEGAPPDLLVNHDQEELDVPEALLRLAGEDEPDFPAADIRLTTGTLEYPSVVGDSTEDHAAPRRDGMRSPARSRFRWAALLTSAALSLGMSLERTPPVWPSRECVPVRITPRAASPHHPEAGQAPALAAFRLVGQARPPAPAATVRGPDAPSPSPPDREAQVTPVPVAERPRDEIVAVPEEGRGLPDVGPVAAEPIRPAESAPVVSLPPELSLRAGEQARSPVRVIRGGTVGPLTLQFQGLPRGVALQCPSILEGAETAEATLSASADAAPGVAEVSVGLASRPDRTPARFRLRILPGAATAAFESGRAHFLRAAYKQAVAEFTRAIQSDPKLPGAHFARGLANHLDGCYREALADYTEAIRAQPDRADAYLLRGRIHQELGAPDLALSDYTEAIRVRPGGATAYLARAWLHHESGDYGQALADLSEAIRRRPDDSTALYRRGLVRYHSGDLTGAIADFSVVIRLNPKHANAYRSRSEAFARMGDRPRASADHDTFGRLVRDQAHHDPAQPPKTPPAQTRR